MVEFIMAVKAWIEDLVKKFQDFIAALRGDKAPEEVETTVA